MSDNSAFAIPGLDANKLAAPEFTPAELGTLHRWCCDYRDFVRVDGMPTPQTDETFLLFSRVCYAEGVTDAG